MLALLREAPLVMSLGINSDARALDDLVRLDGFVDDFRADTTYRGRPVLRTEEIPAGSAVVSCVTNSRPHTALARLRDSAAGHVTDVLTVAASSEGALPPPAFVVESRDAYASHHERWDAVRGVLADEESRTTFDAVSRYRLEGDLRHTATMRYRPDEQYFEPFVELRPGDVFVDGGGYDGATTLGFVQRCPDYGSAHVFEPVPAALDTARALLAGHRDIVFHQSGLYDRDGTVGFDAGAGSASAIVADGTDTVPVRRLDDVLGDEPTFVKLDLEGAEMAALRGMRELIRTGRPRLAIAVYHQPSDLWEVPELVLAENHGYDVRLRHYTESWTETVMYFTPNQR